ncbi:MAG: MATE family efflux transporter [Clostridiales bacterium]|nr:MATE family efflux transporter [Clostridiales bacterium]
MSEENKSFAEEANGPEASEARQRSEARRKLILEGNLLKVIFVIALPQVVTMLIDSFYNIADTFFVSRIGDAAIAAVGVNDSLMMIIRAVSIGFGMGSSGIISRSLGAKKDEFASRVAVTTWFTAAATLSVVAVTGSVFLHPLVNMLGATDTVRPYSMQYARWILLSAPITATTVCLSQILRSEGNTVFSMIGSVSGCLINIILDPILISYMGLGVAGAAIATDISKVISMVILLSPFLRRKCIIILKPSYFTPKKEIYAELGKMGAPVMMRSCMMSFATILTNNIAAGFGDVALAALSVANKSLRLVASAIMGFGHGFQPIAGYCVGAKKYARALKAFKYTTIIGAIIGLATGGALSLFARQVIQIFSKNEALLELGLIFIRTQSAVLVPHVWGMIVSGFFMALGQPVRAGVMGLSRQLIALIPSVLILSWLFGEVGLACAQAASDVITFILALILVIPVIRRLQAMQKETQ